MIDEKSSPKFDNSFWNDEIGNFQGWESVLRRLRDGRIILKEYSEFLKQRAVIEEQLGKALVKLAKTLLVREEVDDLRYVWEVLKAETENSGLTHLKSSHQLLAEANKVTEFNENFREKRRIREDVVRGHQQNLKLQWKRLCDSKRNYESRCREEVVANQFYHQEVSRLGKNSKEAEKAQAKYTKARLALDFSQSSYQSAVTAVEEARTSWEKETERTFISFQGLEEDRLSNIRDSMWRLSNIVSQATVDDDRSAEEVRKSLESCDLTEAMNKFIANNSTGEKRPSSITFKPQPTSSSIGLGRAESTTPSLSSFKEDRGRSPIDNNNSKTNTIRRSNESHSLTVQPHIQQQQQQQQHQPSYQHLFTSSRSQTPFHQQYSKPVTTNPTGSVSLSSLHEFVRANTNSYNRAQMNINNNSNNNNFKVNGDMSGQSRTNSQISLATSPDVLQNTSQQQQLSSSQQQQQTPLWHGSLAGLPQHPPARPRKPPRLMHYANMSFQSMNRSRSCSPEKPVRILDTVENTEYFNLPDDRGTTTPPSSSDYQSDLSAGSGGEQTTGNDSGIYSLSSPSSRDRLVTTRPPSPARRKTLVTSPVSVSNNRNIQRNTTRNLSPVRRQKNVSSLDRSWNMNHLASHAVVLQDYKRSSPNEISLVKNQVVQILDSMPGSDWWRIRDDFGRDGFYPANLLKLI